MDKLVNKTMIMNKILIISIKNYKLKIKKKKIN